MTTSTVIIQTVTMNPGEPITTAAKPRIAIAGLSVESSTFSPARTTVASFRPQRGPEILAGRPFWAPGGSLAEAAEWVPILQGRSIPGGPVPAADYQKLKDEIVAGLVAAGPLDGLVLDIHGAMSVLGMDDAEGDLAEAVRAAVGPEVLISTGMDLHGNVSLRLAHVLDLLTCYRMAPHEDAVATKERAVGNLITRLALPPDRRRPLKAHVAVPILLPGEKTSTRLEPARSLYARVPDIEALPGVLDAGIWIGYAWADEPRNSCVVMVTGDDAEVITAEAEQLAAAIWAARDEFAFVAPAADLDTCLDTALASTRRPYVISDSGDNPTAGGAGDVTWTLDQLLQRPELINGELPAVYASIPDPEAARACVAAGVGADVVVRIGARVDDRHCGPVELCGVVKHLANSDPEAVIEAVVSVGGLDVIITERRKPYHLLADFVRNGIDPAAIGLLVVKIGYLEPELFALAEDWMLALTPGGVDQDLGRLGHSRIKRPMFPFDSVTRPGGEFTPELAAVMVPASNQTLS